jgi:hypothetical protein
MPSHLRPLFPHLVLLLVVVPDHLTLEHFDLMNFNNSRDNLRNTRADRLNRAGDVGQSKCQ